MSGTYTLDIDLTGLAHRQLQTLAEAFTYQWLGARDSDGEGDGAEWGGSLLTGAVAALEQMANQQEASGLFLTGDNVLSPPDSSFSINGLCRLIRVMDRHPRPELEPVRAAAAQVVRTARDALVGGGVHTPNHRWELSCALVQIGTIFGDQGCLTRAEEWLAEGIDLQTDGMFSERSPNYGAFVSGPCLLEMGELLDREDLVDAVHTHLHATVDLIDTAGIIDTLASRRQDQGSRFPLANYALLYARLAVLRDCAACRAAARDAAQGSIEPAQAVASLAEVLLHPALAEDRGPGVRPVSPPGWRQLASSGLAIWRDGDQRVVAHAASDVAALQRIGSGINSNPTFATIEGAGMKLGLRLSRDFFNLGPFRADELGLDGAVAVLAERTQARYYHPLPPGDRHPDGDYQFGFEGRFSAQMAFDQRRFDEVELSTAVRLQPTTGAVALHLGITGPVVSHLLEVTVASTREGALALAPIEGGIEQVDDSSWVVGSDGTLADGRLGIRLEGDFARSGPLMAYHPGDAYRYLGGTDATTGVRLLIGFSGPGARVVRFSFAG